ncbi:uncharacterized protein LACBIDRAFT_333152 [Laccaria bicolor S238N-H82]|uniref:Predicted protein n=1 Tax=Laccaria bicolor (strain S238N-H82 / ATCC MYA-4686) TaxID=486041 RepID=B0DV24_LACBS|nr:uncharacterized protein LACBIDRAFT_333152 [Laccaria bicolor S238N-H82]EDR01438.1 predicted protein [Laccaria bicolor S238N-H82]|eukprot:XP_001887790.1 predicted protein [Laccaria bicolor S238N-H82]
MYKQNACSGIQVIWRVEARQSWPVKATKKVIITLAVAKHVIGAPLHLGYLRHIKILEDMNGTFLNTLSTLARGGGSLTQMRLRILTSYLSLLANRSYVFEDYTWSHLPFPYTLDNFELRPTHIPMNAFISGPTAGGPLPHSDTTYRAVSAEHYDCVCPSDHPGKVIIDARTVGSPSRAGGMELVQWWVDKIDSVASDAECVEIREGDVVGRVFDSYFFGIPSQFLLLLPDLFLSPILHSFTWSPLILSAIVRNFNIFEMGSNSMVTGLLAVHLRRGDYERHCLRLADWRSTWMGRIDTSVTEKLNQEMENVAHAAAVKAYYLSRCLPSVDQVVKRLRDVKLQWESGRGSNSSSSYFPARKLDKIYMLTNAASSYIVELEQALIQDGWGGSSGKTVLISTRDMQERLDAEQKYVSVGVDMAIAERAEVFVGNGIISTSTSIVGPSPFHPTSISACFSTLQKICLEFGSKDKFCILYKVDVRNEQHGDPIFFVSSSASYYDLMSAVSTYPSASTRARVDDASNSY